MYSRTMDYIISMIVFFFFQAEDGIRDYKVTGVQTCALPICPHEAVTQAGRRPVAAAVPGAARQRPGPAGPDTRRVRGRPRPDHGQRAALQYAQKRAPAPAGCRLAAPVRRGPAPGTHGLCGYALRAAVPSHSRGHPGTALAFRRRDRPGPRLRRHEPALA